MWFKNFIKSLTSTSTSRRASGRSVSRARLEALEDRLTPSFTVADNNIGVSTGIYPRTALAADFNNDLIPDLAVSTGAVLLANGNGTFGAAQSFAANGHIDKGDFNGDGNVDLVTANAQGGLAIAESRYPTVMRGNGDGTLQSPYGVYLEIPPAPPYQFLYSFNTTFVAVADANADGRQDLLFVGQVCYADDNGEEFHFYGYTAVSLGRGDGTFVAGFHDLSVAAYGPPDFVAADFNADGKVDMVGSNGLRLGRGDGSFDAFQVFSAGPQGHHVAVDDFNGDGKLDIAATSGEVVNGGFIRLGIGNGTVQPAQSFSSTTRLDFLATEDFNGDGKTDLVTASGGNSFPTPSVTVRLGNGNGTFLAPLSFPASPASGGLTGLTAADFNGDGRADLAAIAYTNSYVYPSNLRILLNDGNWTPPPRSITISDVTKSEGRKGKTLFTFTVSLSGASDQAVTMSYQTVNGTAKTSDSDYVAKSGMLTFAPGQTTKTITIEVKGDSKREANETFYLDLFGLSGNALFTDSSGLGTILNDD